MNKEYKKMSLHEIRQTELQLLIDFADFCEKNGLYYTLCGGTLLGAIRHKGFIPWDDDIDVLMPRPDFERLLNGQDLDYGGFASFEKLVHWRNGTLNYPFAKLLDTRTKLKVDYVNEKLDAGHIWIDIFPIDGCPDEPERLNKIYKKSFFWRKMLLLRLAQRGEGKTAFKRLLKPLLIAPLQLISTQYLCNKIDTLSRTVPFDTTDFICGISWGYGVKEKIHRKPYVTPISVEFEGRKFIAPENYSEYLGNLYGNYMELPPENQRISHGMEAYIET